MIRHKPTLVIGLTGGIGSGKSEVTRRFSNLGVTVVDADEIAREVVAPGQTALIEIAEKFGDDILTGAGELDRPKLRDIIFTDSSAKHWLENLLHPLINHIIRTRLRQTASAYVILSSPLLLETQQHQLVDRTLVIDTSEALQLARASQRDSTRTAQIKAIMLNQMARRDRLARADDIIHNLGNLSDVDVQVNQLHQHYLSLAQAHNNV